MFAVLLRLCLGVSLLFSSGETMDVYPNTLSRSAANWFRFAGDDFHVEEEVNRLPSIRTEYLDMVP